MNSHVTRASTVLAATLLLAGGAVAPASAHLIGMADQTIACITAPAP